MAQHCDDTLTAELCIGQSHNNAAGVNADQHKPAGNVGKLISVWLELELRLTFLKMTQIFALSVAAAELQATLI